MCMFDLLHLSKDIEYTFFIWKIRLFGHVALRVLGGVISFIFIVH